MNAPVHVPVDRIVDVDIRGLPGRERAHAPFGDEAHTCPGAPLARSGIAIMLEAWLARIPHIVRAGDDHGDGPTDAVNALSGLDLTRPVPA